MSNQQGFIYCDSVPNVLSLTGTDSQGCPTDTVSITFENIYFGIDTLTITSTADTVLFGGSIDLCVIGNLSNMDYLWDNGGTGDCITVFPVDSMTYCTTVTDSCGRIVNLCYSVFAEPYVSVFEKDHLSVYMELYENGFSINTLDELENYKLIVLDSYGREVLTDEMYQSGKKVDTDFLASGMYYVTAIARNVRSTLRYVK